MHKQMSGLIETSVISLVTLTVYLLTAIIDFCTVVNFRKHFCV